MRLIHVFLVAASFLLSSTAFSEQASPQGAKDEQQYEVLKNKPQEQPKPAPQPPSQSTAQPPSAQPPQSSSNPPAPDTRQNLTSPQGQPIQQGAIKDQPPPQQPANAENVAERRLQSKLQGEEFQQWKQQYMNLPKDSQGRIVVPDGCGRGAPCAHVWFDQAGRREGAASDPVRPPEDRIFRGGAPAGQAPIQNNARQQPSGQYPPGTQAATGNPPTATQPSRPSIDRIYVPSPTLGGKANNPNAAPPQPTISGNYKPITPETAKAVRDRYGTIPGGVVLEGKATGLGRITKVRYHAGLNAFMLDDRAAYFIPIPPVSAAVLCRAIAQDDKVGVSLGETQIVYGAVPPDSDLAFDLKLADHFLGDIVFAGNDWTAGYQFANGFKPQARQGEYFPIAVFFNFTGFQFRIADEEVQLTGASFDVQLVPLSANKAADGGHLPDLDAITKNRKAQQYEQNVRHVAENIGYYRQERIVNRTFAYGEVAAFIRGLRDAGVNLRELAQNVEASYALPSR